MWLARLLTQAGAEVDVVMTRGAREFVGPITFEAVTARPVYTEIFGPGHALDHIKLAREANTIGSKANDAPMLDDVIAIKEELERIREQVENLE